VPLDVYVNPLADQVYDNNAEAVRLLDELLLIIRYNEWAESQPAAFV
jgi:hypothetical protein